MLFNSYRLRCTRKKGLVPPKEFSRAFDGDALLVPTDYPIPYTIFQGAAAEGFRRLIGELVSLPREEYGRQWGWAMSMIGLTERVHLSSGMSIPIDQERLEYWKWLGKDIVLLCVGNRVRLVSYEDWRQVISNPASGQARELLESIEATVPYVWSLDPAMEEEIERAFRVTSRRGVTREDARRFEIEVAEALSSMKTGLVELTQFGSDEGIDVVLHLEDSRGISSVYVQCKNGQRRVTVKEVRELIGVVARDGASAGLLVSTAGFTRGAIRETSISRIRVSLATMSSLATNLESQLLRVL